jgi:hypothetical protein
MRLDIRFFIMVGMIGTHAKRVYTEGPVSPPQRRCMHAHGHRMTCPKVASRQQQASDVVAVTREAGES